MTKGAVYWHFASKNDLFLALLQDRLQSPLSIPPKQAQAEFARHKDPQDAVKTLLSGQLNYAQANPDWCRLYFEFMVQSREADVQKVLSAIALEDRQAAINQLVRKMQENGILRDDVDPLTIVLFWSALVDGLILARLIDPQRLDPAA
ncbi:TetR/AcrR family transcriptional regulator [Pleurocapsales cyanobacterium LEGE 06147]|nr:TetR/AcrR family transcriptional regulator [Pleurocapsales cyanobacterium LEGE 06147]